MFAPSLNLDLEAIAQKEEEATPAGKKVAAKGRSKTRPATAASDSKQS